MKAFTEAGVKMTVVGAKETVHTKLNGVAGDPATTGLQQFVEALPRS
jgi:hypothetical protein